MKKLNNKGITLVELLVSLAILCIFMVTVNYFVTAATKSSKRTKEQVNVQRDSQDVYDTLYDAVIQATGIEIATSERISATGTPASGDASADADMRIRKSANFESKLSSKQKVFLVSNSAFDSMEYAQEKYNTVDDYQNDHKNISISRHSQYEKDKVGKIVEKDLFVSVAQYMGASSVLSIADMDYGAFDGGEYSVDSIIIGPAKPQASGSVYNTIMYKDNKIYLNRNSSNIWDLSIKEENVIADNCTEFTVTVPEGNNNSLNLKLTFSNGGYSYTVGGTINLRNANIMK